MTVVDFEARWEANCEILAHSGNRGTRLALALDPECGRAALRYMADHDTDAEVRSVAVEMMVRRGIGHQLPLFGDAA